MLKNCKIIYIYDKKSLYFRDIDTPYPFARKRLRHKKRTTEIPVVPFASFFFSSIHIWHRQDTERPVRDICAKHDEAEE